MKRQIPEEKLTPVGKMLRQFRAEKELTLKDLSEATNYTKAYWSGVARGTIDAHDDVIKNLVEIYDLDNLEEWLYKNSISKKLRRIRTGELTDEIKEMIHLVATAAEEGVIPQEMINYVVPTLKWTLGVGQPTEQEN